MGKERTNRLLSDREIRKVKRKESEVFAVKLRLQRIKCLFRIKWENHLRRQD